MVKRDTDQNWIQTYSGLPYWPANPRVEDVRLEDISHGLSMLCRYAGQTRKFYCVTPETRILTHDFRWLAAGNITSGTLLWGFDDKCGGKGHRVLKKWRPSLAISHGKIIRDVIEITTEDGSALRCSEEHPLLSATKLAGNTKWLTAAEIHHRKQHGSKNHPTCATYLPKYVEPWGEEDTSKEAGWLAGMFDGEGTASSMASRGRGLSIAQNPGELLELIKIRLTERRFCFTQSDIGQHKYKNVVVRGGLSEQMRLLGSVRPIRLIANFCSRLDGTDLMRQKLVRVVSTKQIGPQEVIALETSSHTYITEGFGSHNSVAEHCVHVSQLVPPELALEGLLHDASEAYCSDIVRPLKQVLPGYKRVEARNMAVIREKFGLPACEHKLVKRADTAMLLVELKDLLPPFSNGFTFGVTKGMPTPDIIVWGWNPREAEIFFLERFHEIRKEWP